MHRCNIVIILIVATAGGSTGFHPHLKILPSGLQEVRVGNNLVLTCTAAVPNLELIRDLKWWTPSGQEIPQDDRIYSEELPGDASIALFLKQVNEADSGRYKCSATYATNEKLESTVDISTIIGITWDDAPQEQYARINQDYKIKCVVRANPPANIDWLKEALIISTGNQYVIESNGLLVKGVTRYDAGIYTCRARVAETGELEERDITLDVQEPPRWRVKPADVRGAELDKREMECDALGSPKPQYTWVDWEGIDATERHGWKIDETTGTLTAFHLRREDAGTYTCIAENQAGRIQADAQLSVIIRPKVQELFNKTFPVGMRDARLTCRASGDPMPDIIWRKWSRNEHYLLGGQPDDRRIIVEERITEAFDSANTEGERYWKESSIIIDGIERSDDGLYECQAANEGGTFFKSGHIQVEFGPTFEEQPFFKEWSWDQKPINLTCIATSIPNATVTWWYNELEIGVQDLDRNFKIQGKGPRSDLVVTPLSNKYYGRYRCKAENPYGIEYTEITLEEAHVPTLLQQAILDKYTATTLEFRFVAPTDSGGLPIESYAAEYKESRQPWEEARRRVWPSWNLDQGGFILEDLRPATTYDLRFGSRNRVGFSQWGANQQITTPRRGAPEAPILHKRTGAEREIDGNVVEISHSDHYEVSWQIPEDNGVPIDYFLLTYYPIRKDSNGATWSQVGDIQKIEIPHRGNVRWDISLPYPDTYYKIQLEAHNDLGFSQTSTIIIKSAQGRTTIGTKIPPPEYKVSSGFSIHGSSSFPIVIYMFMVFKVILSFCEYTATGRCHNNFIPS